MHLTYIIGLGNVESKWLRAICAAEPHVQSKLQHPARESILKPAPAGQELEQEVSTLEQTAKNSMDIFNSTIRVIWEKLALDEKAAAETQSTSTSSGC